MQLKERLLAAMQQKGINQRQLAEMSGCSETTISKWLNKPQNFRMTTITKLEKTLGVTLISTTPKSFQNSIFAEYQPHKSTFSESLFWEYDKNSFIPSEHKEIVVSRVIDRGRINDYFAAFDACGGIDGFKETYKKLKKTNKYSRNFICNALNIKKEELSCSI